MTTVIFTTISAILAALLGAGVTHYFAVRRERARNIEDRKRDEERESREKQRIANAERRELLGLLRLIHVEVVNNIALLKGMGAKSGTVIRGTEKLKRGADSLGAPNLSTGAWEQARTRIAALLEDEERLKHIIGGYAALEAFKQRLLNPDTDRLSGKEHAEATRQVERHQWLTFDACQKETGMFWAWSKGMLVSESADENPEAWAHKGVEDLSEP